MSGKSSRGESSELASGERGRNASPQSTGRFDAQDTKPIAVEPIATSGGKSRPVLVVIAGPQIGQLFKLEHKSVRLGRAEDAEIPIRDGSISRYHAECYFDEHGGMRVRDLGSTNGTFMNGVKVTDSEIREGDRVQLGGATILKLEFHGSIEGQFHTQLYEAGTRDALTGVFNRRYLDQQLDTDFRLARRHKQPLSVLVIDVDHFKQINDQHGHLAGDAVLRTLGEVLGSRLRGEDILGRFGGEEFVVIMRQTDLKGAAQAAESVRRIVEETTFGYQALTIPVTVSIGVAALDPMAPHEDVGALLQAADRALYQAKQSGRNQVQTAN